MMRTMMVSFLLLSVACLVGCGAQSNTPAAAEAGHEEHVHPTEGPHGGSIVELGTEERHAELVHDQQSGEVTVYFLDSSAKLASPIDATQVTINLRHDGRAEQFTLAAAPVEGEVEGMSSRFVSTDKELAEDLDHSEAHGQLVAVIGGKQYRGNIEHDHGHDHVGEQH